MTGQELENLLTTQTIVSAELVPSSMAGFPNKEAAAYGGDSEHLRLELASGWVFYFPYQCVLSVPPPHAPFRLESQPARLGDLARDLSVAKRLDAKLREEDARRTRRRDTVIKVTQELRDRIIATASAGERRLEVMVLDPDAVHWDERTDIPVKLLCPVYQDLWNYLEAEGLIPGLGCRKVCMGTDEAFLTVSW